MTHPAPRVLVVGDLMLDRYLWGSSNRLSPEAPVPVVDVVDEAWTLGGAGNVAANLRSLEAEVCLVSLTGTDSGADKLHSLLDAISVTDAGLVVDATRPVTVKTRVMAARHQLMRFDVEQRGAVSDRVEAALRQSVDDALPGCHAVVLSDYGKGVLTPALCRYVIDAAKQIGLPVVVDPKGRDYQKYRGATVVTPNRKEAAEASGLPLDSDDSLAVAGESLRQTCELTACLITLSEGGMALFTQDRSERIATQAREVFDVSGAGDTVVAALTLGLAQGQSVFEACRFANLAAGVVVGKLGVATATRTEVEAFARATSSALASAKVLRSDQLPQVLENLRSRRKRIVFTNGCFDILHAGHVRYLEGAAGLGDVLMIGVNDDASVRRLKGAGRPINEEEDRLFVLAGLASVDFVLPFGEDTPIELIEAIRPDVLVKGGDYTEETIVGAPFVRSYGGEVTTVPLHPGRSTTETIARAQGNKP